MDKVLSIVRRLAAAALWSCFACWSASPLLAEEAPRRGPTDAAEVEAFVDGVMAAALADKHVAGATVSVVRDGALLFAKGYGYADVAKRQPVDPERTLFRIGSVSKLFTWTAVMQLRERGQLDLDQDVNGYLDWKIPATFEQPITLRHFLTHTPGLEEDGRDLFTVDPQKLEPLGQWLPAHMPARVRPPGVYSSYSNWGTATAGYIVERVSGTAYDDFLEQNIFQPLGMVQASARQPLPEALAPDMSQGYKWQRGGYSPEKWEIITGAAPAGSMSASATAMARFMLAFLGQGELDGQRILEAGTVEQMLQRSFTHHPRLNGFGLGFYEKSSHGVRVVGHGGDTQWFHTDLALFPEERLGVFVSFNTNTGGMLSFGPFLDAFLDHYYPAPLPVATKVEGGARFAGTYLFNRMSRTTFQKALGLAGALPLRVGPDSSLVLASPFGEMRFVQIEPLIWQQADGQSLMVFREGPGGRITHASWSKTPMMTLERWSGLRSPGLHRVLLAAGVVASLLFVVAAVARFFRQRRGEGTAPPPPLRTGRRMMTVASLCVLSFVAALGALASKPEQLMGDTPRALQAALALPVLGLLFTLLAGWFGWRAWRQGSGTRWDRVRLSAAVAVVLLFAWSLNLWNLLGWRM